MARYDGDRLLPSEVDGCMLCVIFIPHFHSGYFSQPFPHISGHSNSGLWKYLKTLWPFVYITEWVRNWFKCHWNTKVVRAVSYSRSIFADSIVTTGPFIFIYRNIYLYG